MLQIWACGVAEHRHIAKSEALKCVDEMQKAAALTVLGEAAAAAIAEGNAERAAKATLDPGYTLSEAEKEALAAEVARRQALAEGNTAATDPAATDRPEPDSAVADLIARGRISDAVGR